jgi:O-acetyl-ADP-ribose deacetylase (regulator of RNase III)
VDVVLCDTRPEVLEAWQLTFARRPEVKIVEGDILSCGCEAVVCPGNSFGFMDSGLSLRALERFGFVLQDHVRTLIRERFDHELLVGQAALVDTEKAPRWLVYAPVTRTGFSSDGTLNAYHATRGALLAIRDYNRANPQAPIANVVLPGLCAETGGTHPAVSGRQMRYAYELAAGLKSGGAKHLTKLARREARLKALPKVARVAEVESEADL